MDIQWTTAFFPAIAAIAVIYAVFAAGLWFLLGLRLAPVRRDLSESREVVSKIGGTLSDIDENVSDLNAKCDALIGNCDALNGRFDVVLVHLRGQLEIDRQPKAVVSEDPAREA